MSILEFCAIVTMNRSQCMLQKLIFATEESNVEDVKMLRPYPP
jgi:hypothetical protein